ncbi:MAG: delta-aminolevulinic acid dehydratase [Bacteroidia bacterium]
MEREEFKGYDPYDGLLSPLFKLPLLSAHHTLRFYAQQAVKRSRINLRPILGIKKGLNPVTLGLAVQSYTTLYSAVKKEEYRQKAEQLITQLEQFSAKGFHGTCWGYDFPWEARYATIPAYQPTVVATGIIANGLYEAAVQLSSQKAREMVVSAAEFVLHDLNRKTDTDQSFCFSYSPFDHEMVFNASMKGARLLSQAYALTGKEEFITTATNAIRWVMKNQDEQGVWIYSKRESGKWVDNYHTGYILDCLSAYIQLSGDTSFAPALNKGLNYYANNFISADGQPKFYNNERYPADCTAAGQTLLTLTRFKKYDEARAVAHWMLKNMQAADGHFYFRKYKSHTEKTDFMRWSNAWMLAGLSALYPHLN